MATSEMQKQEKSRSRFLIIAAAVMLLLACGVFGSLFYLQRQSATSGEAAIEARVAAEKAALEPTEEISTKQIAHLNLLRDKWRPWALKHKEELKRMLRAESNDHAAFTAVYDAIPALPHVEDAGFTPKELDSSSPEMMFSWQQVGKLNKSFGTDAKAQEDYKKNQQFRAKRLQRHFATLHDIELSSSMNTGRTHVTFWATGRITRGKWIDNPNTSAGQPTQIEAPLEELQPPYDFLK